MLKALKQRWLDPKSKEIAGRLFKEHIKHYRRYFSFSFIFMILAALSTAALPYLLQPVFDDVFNSHDPYLLVFFCSAVLLAFVLKGIASYGEAVTMIFIGQKIISDLQNRLFHHLLTLDLSFFHQTSSGDLLSRFTNDINMMRSSVANTVVGLGKDTFTLLFLILVMFYRDYLLASIAFFVFPIALLPIANIGKRMRKITLNTQHEIGTFTTQLTQIFQGIRVVKAYTMESYETKRIEDKINSLFKWVYKATRVRSLGHLVVESLGGLAIISVIAYGGWQVMHDNRTTGEFVSFIAALLLAYEPFKRLSHLNTNLQEGLAAASRVFSLLDIKPTIVDRLKTIPLVRAKGEVVFDHVSFRYPSGILALDNVSLTIKVGQTVALVGTSGSGKSTFINLIPRFYDVCKGSIKLDNINIQHFPLKDLRNQIALVSQEIMLFDDSIKTNIACGNPTVNDQNITQAAQDAAAHEFIIAHLPQRYDTLVGENGIKLSGGQRQRIAIARAMLKNAPLLLLDEATSALDTNSERQVQTALKTLMKGRTTIMIAHRLSTVIEADMIYVLQDGKIIECGNHTALLQKQSVYAQLWKTQIHEKECNLSGSRL